MDASELAKKKCLPCAGGQVVALARPQIFGLLEKLKGWTLKGLSITKDYSFKDFKTSLAFVNAVGQIAEAEAHHPDIFIQYNKVKLVLTTQALSAVTENDFILAAKVDALIAQK